MQEKQGGYQFNTFCGVFLPSILTILGVVMFMRLGTIVGELGILGGIGILLFGESIAVATGLSISSISTNTPVQSGGPYFLISRSLGPGFGSSIGLTYFVSQSLSVPFYIIGFTEAVVTVFPNLAQYQLAVSLIPLLLLFTVALIGANWAIRTQYFIMAILGISILVIFLGAFAAGPSVVQLNDNLFTPRDEHIDILKLAACFAVFFPAVTGFLSGVNMSGDLADARKSIPKGTMIAISVGFLIYLSEIILFGATWSRETLIRNTYGTLVKSAIWNTGFLVFAGMAAATLSSALGTLLGAPRILQAFASDKIFPVLNFFAKGRGRTNDPVPAMVLTLCISAFVICWSSISKGNALNTVAELVTMFTLCTYAIINISASVEHFAANPSFRPKFHMFHWTVGCYGAFSCLVAALFINPSLLIIAFVIVGTLFFLAKRQSAEITFGDARRGYYFEHIRRYLLKLASMPPDSKNWRPQLLVLAGKDKRHEILIRVGALLNNERGILSVLRIVANPLNQSLVKERQNELRRMQEKSNELETEFFPEIIVTSQDFGFDTALNIYLQSHSHSPLSPNIVLSGWPVQENRIDIFFRHLRTIRQLQMNSLIFLNPHKMSFNPSGTIDIWWRGRRNGSLMVILAYLLSCNRNWRHCTIRLIRISSKEGEHSAEKELDALIEDARIEAEKVILSDEVDFETAIRKESMNASIIFLGYILSREFEDRPFYDRMNHILNDMPATFLVSSAGDTDIDS